MRGNLHSQEIFKGINLSSLASHWTKVALVLLLVGVEVVMLVLGVSVVFSVLVLFYLRCLWWWLEW